MSFAPPPSASGRQNLSLATSLSALGRRGQNMVGQTPLTATSHNSPFTAGGYNPHIYTAGGSSRGQAYLSATPQTAAQSAPYNPQQWNAGASPAAGYVPHAQTYGGQQVVQQPAPSRGSPSDVIPPPPYSPRRPGEAPQAPTASIDHQSMPSPQPTTPNPPIYLTTSPPPAASHASPASTPQVNGATPPSQDTNYAFPPPPPVSGRRARSSSRSNTNDARQTMFSLSALRGRNHQPEQNQYPVETSRNAPPPPVPTDVRPPAARRAASTGTIGASSVPLYRRPDNQLLQMGQQWVPSMGVPPPPPPPGPPPANSRSQSVNRTPVADWTTGRPPPPTRRPPPSTGSQGNLPPVPPTPADWIDETPVAEPSSSRIPAERGLQLDTSAALTATTTTSTTTTTTTTAAAAANDVARGNFPTTAAPSISYDRDGLVTSPDTGFAAARLARAGTVRGDKGIRERRSESRTGKERAVEPQTAVESARSPWTGDLKKPADLDLKSPGGSIGLTRRPAVDKRTPRSARGVTSPDTAGAPNSAASLLSHAPGSAATATPRAVLSPDTDATSFSQAGTPATTGKSQASPAVRRFKDSGRPPSGLAVRTPGEMQRPSSSFSNGTARSDGPSDEFAQSAMDRHDAFARREARAKSDKQRVAIFAEYIVAESRLRRERYAGAMDEMGSEILELTRDLFRPYQSTKKEILTPTSGSSAGWSPAESHGGSLSAAAKTFSHSNGNASAPGSAKRVEPDSPASASSTGTNGRGGGEWIGGYMPSLSPIPSMSVSEIPDELSSRGRPASRWWEASQEGSIYGGGSRGLERSKRESKYMGLPRELRENMQWGDQGETSSGSTTTGGRPTVGKPGYGPEEYPAEKTGWHDTLPPPPPLPSTNGYDAMCSPAPFTPDPRRLDVSRLVTLPPPYPRHYPAVNNNHPDLTSIRTVVRAVSDFSEMISIKEKHMDKVDAARDALQDECKKRNSLLRKDMQRQIEAGEISYVDAGKMEAAVEDEQKEKKKQQTQLEFDTFQRDVVKPVHSLLSDRAERCTESFDELRKNLFVDAQERNPNSTQEQGDEQPELLEKLTLLKWLFEAREQLQREMYDLLSERNERYKAMVVQPYRLMGNEQKAVEAEAFFRKDGQERKVAHEKDMLRRVEEFMEVVEENVVRGVEVQLSAFWDIAPGLVEILLRVPRDLDGAEIHIPPDEYAENPSYHTHPCQYLYSLLEHAGKSTYQFIEAQTNLLCLLHEVKSGVTAANCRLLETQRYLEGEAFEAVDREMGEVRRDEERRLTDDLKEKVRMVENQWREALGEELEKTKERVADFLVGTGGWEEETE